MILVLAILLGILQTFTEIFPLSNRAHLMLLEIFFGYKKSFPAYDVMIDCGTLLAFFAYFSKDIIEMIKGIPAIFRWPFAKNKSGFFLEYPYALTLCLLLIASLVTGFVRFTFQDAGDTLARSLTAAGIVWAIMGGLIFLSRKLKPGVRSLYEVNHQDAFLIGMAQGFAIFPGVSRIGAAVLVAMALGIERKDAARFSVLLGLPYIICAIIYKFSLGPHFYDSDQGALLVSLIAAAAAGVLFLSIVMKMIQQGKFFIFGLYCLTLGVLTAIYSLLKAPFF